MKKLLLIVAVAISGFTFAQEKLTFTDLVTVNNKSQNELYNTAKVWFEEMTVIENKTINLEKENAISAKGTMQYEQSWYLAKDATKGVIDFTVTITVTESAYRYEITDFKHKVGADSKCAFEIGILTTAKTCSKAGDVHPKIWIDKNWNEMKENATKEASILIDSLFRKMNNLDDINTSFSMN